MKEMIEEVRMLKRAVKNNKTLTTEEQLISAMKVKQMIDKMVAGLEEQLRKERQK